MPCARPACQDWICWLGKGLGTARDLVGKLLILRLTARGLWRPRLRSAGTARISLRTTSTIRRRWRGGKRGVEGQMAPDHSNRMNERQVIWIAPGFATGLVHETA